MVPTTICTEHQENKKQGSRPELQYNRPYTFPPNGWVACFDTEHDRRPRAYFSGAILVQEAWTGILEAVLVVAKFKGNRKYRDIEVNNDKLWGGYLPNEVLRLLNLLGLRSNTL